MTLSADATRDRLEWMAELGLVAVTVSVAVGFGRLFSDGSLVVPFVLAALVAHALAWGTRKWGAGVVLTVVVAVIGLALFVGLVIEPSTTTVGLPLRETWRTIWNDLSHARSVFVELKAPVAPERGFALACIAALWVAAFVSDWLAFRMRRGYQALIPTVVILVFSAIEGPRSNRIAAMVLYLLTALTFLLLHSNLRRSASITWAANGLTEGPKSVLRGGAVIGSLAVVTGLIFGVV